MKIFVLPKSCKAQQKHAQALKCGLLISSVRPLLFVQQECMKYTVRNKKSCWTNPSPLLLAHLWPHFASLNEWIHSLGDGSLLQTCRRSQNRESHIAGWSADWNSWQKWNNACYMAAVKKLNARREERWDFIGCKPGMSQLLVWHQLGSSCSTPRTRN